MQDGFRNTPTSSQRPECGYKEEVMQWPELWEGGGGGTRRREERATVQSVPFQSRLSRLESRMIQEQETDDAALCYRDKQLLTRLDANIAFIGDISTIKLQLSAHHTKGTLLLIHSAEKSKYNRGSDLRPLQTVEHIITSCPKHQPPNGDRGVIDLDDETLDWFASTELKVSGHTPEEVIYDTGEDGAKQGRHIK
ncbi:hypothetical protein ABVT39_007513 [Epinephelus coioides]